MVSKKLIIFLLIVISIVMLVSGIDIHKRIEYKKKELVKAEYEITLPIID